MSVALSSFRIRLVIGAVLWISIGFAVSWLVLVSLLKVHILREFASELDHHATELTALAVLDPTGHVAMRAPLSDERFGVAGSGYYWQISQDPGNTLASASLGTARLPLDPVADGVETVREARVQGPSGEAMLLERRVLAGGGGGPAIRVAVAMDTRLIGDYIGALETTLAIAMACLAAGLILGAFAQIAFALLPLARIERALGAIRRGEARRMPADLPTEVMPLVDSMNTLLDKNEDMIRRARLEAGNLAHALKSSLAHLQIEADQLTATGQNGEIIGQCCQDIRRQIDYRLARARATASRLGGTPSTRVGPVLANVVTALRRLHVDRPVTIAIGATPADAAVACGVEDLEEVLGNLVDNAAKWAVAQVRVSLEPAAQGMLRIRVEDDGPGMTPDTHERAFQPGERLDETVPGSGLGLAIARDIVGLYDGRMWIDRSSLGGARVTVELRRPA